MPPIKQLEFSFGPEKSESGADLNEMVNVHLIARRINNFGSQSDSVACVLKAGDLRRRQRSLDRRRIFRHDQEVDVHSGRGAGAVLLEVFLEYRG